jgi:hypothetical protein
MVTLKLRKPIRLGEESPLVTELHFREEICAGDMRGVMLRDDGGMTWDENMKVISRLTAQPEPLINKLSLVDALEAVRLASGFTGASQPTGTKPSPSSPPSSTSPTQSSGS